jgi:plastocyanin
MPNGFRLAQLLGSSHFSLVTAFPFRRSMRVKRFLRPGYRGGRGVRDSRSPVAHWGLPLDTLPLWSPGVGLGASAPAARFHTSTGIEVASWEVRIHAPHPHRSHPARSRRGAPRRRVAAAAGRALGGTGAGGASPATTAASSGRYCSSGGGRACGGQSSSGASTTASGTAAAGDNFASSPATLKLKVGQKVSTTNKQQGVAHTVTADEQPSITRVSGRRFRSPSLGRDLRLPLHHPPVDARFQRIIGGSRLGCGHTQSAATAGEPVDRPLGRLGGRRPRGRPKRASIAGEDTPVSNPSTDDGCRIG